MTAEEQWKPIPGFPGYFVSDAGRVVSHIRGQARELRGGYTGEGYRKVVLCNGEHRLGRKVHQIVAEAFHGPCPDGMEVRHRNGDKTQNAASNLRYGTRSENTFDQVEHGVHANARKTRCPAGHEYTPDNTYVSPRGKRMCRTCPRERYQRLTA